MTHIPESLHSLVVDRAGNRCEYCRLSQDGQEARFHVDHVVPISAGGATHTDNLALACVSCSLHKSAKQSAIDPESAKQASIFNPRRESWHEHFAWDGVFLRGISGTRRATVVALRMNRPIILSIRGEEMLRGRHLQ